MYTTRPPPVRSHDPEDMIHTEEFYQNGTMSDYARGDGRHGMMDYMDVGHFRWFWPWGVRRSSTFDDMASGRQELPAAAAILAEDVLDQRLSSLQRKDATPMSTRTTDTPPRPCLLFTKLPLELRLKIWTLVLQTQCSGRWTYAKSSPAWRPDRTGAPFIDTALLRTCRAVYLETWALPMRLTRAALADGTPHDKPGEWANVVLGSDVLVPQVWQILLLSKAEMTMQHFRLEAGFIDMWVAALGKLKSAAAVCLADLVSEARERGKKLNEGVVAMLEEKQAVDDIVIRMNRMDWWSWTDVPPMPWPESLPGICVADVRGGKRPAMIWEEESGMDWEEERQQWFSKDTGMETDEEDDVGEAGHKPGDYNDLNLMLEDMSPAATLSDPEVETHIEGTESAPPDILPIPFSTEVAQHDYEDEQGGYFSDHSVSDSSSMQYVFDAAKLPNALNLEPFSTESWDKPHAYGVLSPQLRVTLMLETYGPKSLQLDEVLNQVKEWQLPMPLVRGQGSVRAGSGVEDTSRVLAWDGREIVEYHWLRDMSDEWEDATFLRMDGLKGFAEGVVVKMLTLRPNARDCGYHREGKGIGSK